MDAVIKTYSVVRDINGWRVIFDDPGMGRSNYSEPQYASVADAHAGAEETLALEEEGRAILAQTAAH